MVLALGRRALSVQFRRAQLLMPTFVLPLMLLAVIASGTSAAQGLRGFPDVTSYLGFVVPGTIIQGTLLAGLTTGMALAGDIEGGFFDRLLAAPVHRASLVVGRLAGTVGLAALQVSFFLGVAAIFGARYPGGVGGLVATVGLGALTAVGIGGIASAIALRTGSLSLLQSIPVRLRPALHGPRLLPAGAAHARAARCLRVQPADLHRGGRPRAAGGRPGPRGCLGGAGGGRRARGRDDPAGHARPQGAAAHPMTALAGSPSLLVIGALWRRSLNEVLRVRGALLPATIAPVVFLLGMSGQFGRLTGLDGFPTDSYLSWVLPLSCLQGAGFAGAATGANLARDIEQGLFDRFLVAPVGRAVLLVGPILGAVTRSLVPTTVVLIVGLALGAELPGGLGGLVALYAAAAVFCAIAGLWGVYLAVTFKTQQAGPLMQQGVFLAVFLSTAYTPQPLLRGWLAETAGLNPVTHVLELARQATVVGIEPSLAHTLPGVVALAGMGVFFGALCLVGVRRMGR